MGELNYLTFRIGSEQRKAIIKCASERGMNTSAFIRECLFTKTFLPLEEISFPVCDYCGCCPPDIYSVEDENGKFRNACEYCKTGMVKYNWKVKNGLC